MTLATLLWLLFAAYVVVVAAFLITENRRPEATLAWLLAFVTLPVIGVILYFFFARGWKAFSQEKKLVGEATGADLATLMHVRQSNADETVQRIEAEKPESYSPNLLRLVLHNSASGIGAHNEVQILQDATEFYPSLLEDLKRAQHHIHMQYFIWSNDPFTQEVKSVLIERARAGVIVRALYDASSKAALGKAYIEEMRAGGVQFLPYLAYNSLRTLHLANYRSHRKITIVDGRVGYLGGMNLDREQMPGTLWPRWRDTQVRIHGESVVPLQVIFLSNWYYSTKDQINDPVYFAARDGDGVTSFLPVQIVASGPDSQWKGIRQLYFYMILAAKERCYIQSPFFIPDETIAEALKSAALSGVDVRVICTPRGAKYQMPYRAALTYFRELSDAGVKFYLYDGGYYHAKTINIDGAICTIGSCNMDIRSYSLDYEINAVLYDAGKACELEEQFRDDLTHSTPFDPAAYDALPWGRRFLDSFWRLASPVM
jgi:cardiolipin synthase